MLPPAGPTETEDVLYLVVLEQGPNNWGDDVPDAWGCVSTGKTRELGSPQRRHQPTATRTDYD